MSKMIWVKRLVKISLVSLFLTACLKKQNLEDPQVGPALNPDDVAQKMMSDVGVFSLGEIKKGEYSSIVQSQIIEETSVTQLFQQDVFVDKVTTEAGDVTYDLLMNFIDKRSSDNSIYNIAYPIKSSDDLRNDNAPVVLFYEFLKIALTRCREVGISCHNLNISNETFLLNPELAHDSICSDKDRCEVKTKTIAMDMLYPRKDGSKQKVNYTFVLAPQLPFLSRVLKFCERTVVKSNPRNYLQEMCMNLTNFRVGTNTP